MPRRALSPGGKPFELRTGVGLPALGGIFRAGDPATVPPHKHHLVVNARITPGGLFSRPGLVPVHDTTVSECIVGLTEFPQSGGGMILWPGCGDSAGNGNGPLNPVSMRRIFPAESESYSEYVFAVYGALGQPACTSHPIVDFGTGVGWGSQRGQRPFIYRGQIHYFGLSLVQAPAGGFTSSPVSLLTFDLPPASGMLGTNLYRYRCCFYANGTAAPYVSGQPCPPGTEWPRGHPFSSARHVVSLPAQPWTGEDGGVETVLTMAERSDEVLDGDTTVDESAYVVMVSATGKSKLYRWDGHTLAEETLAIADFTVGGRAHSVRLAYGGSGNTMALALSGTPGKFWARDEAGAWGPLTAHALDGGAFYPLHGFSWAGTSYFLGIGATDKPILLSRAAGAMVLAHDFFAVGGYEAHDVSHIAQLGPSVYMLLKGAGAYTYLPARVLRFNLSTGLVVGAPLVLRSTSETDEYGAFLWLQVCGTTVYCGGLFQWDLVLDAAEPENAHCVYNITDPSAPVLVYRTYGTEVAAYESDGDRYSMGALPFVPAEGSTEQRLLEASG